MNPRQAINVIKLQLGGHPNKIIKNALKAAEEALEKQVPKKPEIQIAKKPTEIGHVKFDTGTKVYKCSSCNEFILPSAMYCSHCGQRLEE